MLFGFFKHMYKYFVIPDEPDEERIGFVSNKLHSPGDIVPLYDEFGEVTGYMLKPKKPQIALVCDSDKVPSVHLRHDIVPLYDKDGDVTGYMPKPKKKLDESFKRPIDMILGVTGPPPSRPKKAVDSQASESDCQSRWDGWPDGTFEREFTFEEVDAYNNLQVHWATKSHGVRGGNDFAEEWIDGKRLRRDCLGIIGCDNPDCTIAIRPQTTPKGIDRQLREACKCGAVLSHIRCFVRSTLWTYSKGVHFTNAGDHNHARPGHIRVFQTCPTRPSTRPSTRPQLR